MDNILILCTINDIQKAKEISQKLLEEKLIACSNIIPNINSLYRWEGKICEDNEFLLILKSRKDLFEEINSIITNIHPYEIPEIISVDIKDGNDAYIEWLNRELK